MKKDSRLGKWIGLDTLTMLTISIILTSFGWRFPPRTPHGRILQVVPYVCIINFTDMGGLWDSWVHACWCCNLKCRKVCQIFKNICIYNLQRHKCPSWHKSFEIFSWYQVPFPNAWFVNATTITVQPNHSSVDLLLVSPKIQCTLPSKVYRTKHHLLHYVDSKPWSLPPPR